VEQAQFYGYDFLQPQPCVLINQELEIDPALSLEAIDAWFANHLAISEERYAESGLLNGDAARNHAIAVITRALALYGEYVTAAGLPCYNAGRIVRATAISGKPDTWRMTIAVTVLDNIPFRIFTSVLRDAMVHVLGRFSVHPVPGETDPILEQIKETTIDQLEKCIPFSAGNTAILDMAHKQNVPYRHFGSSIVRLGWGAKSRLLQHSATEADSALAAGVCGSKTLTARLLNAMGFPGAEHIAVLSLEEAIAAAAKIGWPLVVKPANRERSEGVSINVTDRAGLVAAYKLANELSPQVLVERQAPGVNHRLLVAEGKLIYATKRLPKNVLGDGIHTVAELGEIGNAKLAKMPPWNRYKGWIFDDEVDKVLASQGHSRDSVPAEGERVLMRTMSVPAWGGEIVNLTREVHPDNARLAIEATRALGLSVCGVDLMSTDITRPWHETGGIINEMNFRPQFVWQLREADAASVVPALQLDDCRIPVHAVTGHGDLIGQARALRARLAAAGRKAHLTTASLSEDADGGEIPMRQSQMFDRAVALLMRPDVEELIMVGEPEEFFKRGFAVDRLDEVIILDTDEDRAAQTLREFQTRIAMTSEARVLRPVN